MLHEIFKDILLVMGGGLIGALVMGVVAGGTRR